MPLSRSLPLHVEWGASFHSGNIPLSRSPHSPAICLFSGVSPFQWCVIFQVSYFHPPSIVYPYRCSPQRSSLQVSHHSNSMFNFRSLSRCPSPFPFSISMSLLRLPLSSSTMSLSKCPPHPEGFLFPDVLLRSSSAFQFPLPLWTPKWAMFKPSLGCCCTISPKERVNLGELCSRSPMYG